MDMNLDLESILDYKMQGVIYLVTHLDMMSRFQEYKHIKQASVLAIYVT